jgi:hypothetical protein
LELDKFDGDLRKYPTFKERFNLHIAKDCPKLERAFMLRSHLEPSVREEVENVEDNLMLLWQRLDSKYGNVRKYIDLVLSDLSKVSKGDSKAALHLIKTVEKSYRDLARIGAEQEMSNAYIIAMIEKRLPDEMRFDWVKCISDKAENDSKAVFKLLMNFLERWRQIIEYDESAIRKGPEKKVGLAHHVGSKQTKAKSEVCWMHEGGNHPVWKCKLFQGMNIKDKLDMIKQNNACQACLETNCKGTNDPEQCAKNFKCPINGCDKAHNILIHQ